MKSTIVSDPEYDIEAYSRVYVGEVVFLASKGVCLSRPQFIDSTGHRGTLSWYKQVTAARSEVLGNHYENGVLLDREITQLMDMADAIKLG